MTQYTAADHHRGGPADYSPRPLAYLLTFLYLF
jgi:hypothetical protein